MLTKQELQKWCLDNNIPENGQKLIGDIFDSDPARKVRSGISNVSGTYSSHKMRHTSQTESKTVEEPGTLEYENDACVLAFLDQPNQIKLKYTSLNNKVVGMLHVPDFFVIRTNCAGWEEWKEEGQLQKLALTMPNRYVKEGDIWRCPPGEEYAKQYGFYYRLRSSADINWIRIRNQVFLEDFTREQNITVTFENQQKILAHVNATLGIWLLDLIRITGIDPGDIYRLIILGVLHVNLDEQVLAQPDRVRVFANRGLLESFQEPVCINDRVDVFSLPIEVGIGYTIAWDMRPWRIINVGESSIVLLDEDGTSLDLPMDTFQNFVNIGKIKGVKPQEDPINLEIQRHFDNAGPKDLEKANSRYEIIAPIINGEQDTDVTLSARTKRHLTKLFREGEAVYGSGFINLLPNKAKRGNRTRRLAEQTLDLMTHVIENTLRTSTGISKSLAYGVLQKLCAEGGVYCPSYPTFLKEVDRCDKYDYILDREGPKAAYQHKPFYWELEMTTPRHGDRPWEIGHLDHTELDIELINSAGERLGRPWLSLLVDAFSRRFLALYLTFWKPSIVSCMMIMRECVRRHSRLPQIIVVDGGAEFHSVYFDTLLAYYNLSKRTRPAAQARNGVVVERLFGTTNTQFIHNLAGNTKIMRNVRQVTTAVNPKNLAEWTLLDLYVALSEYAFDFYDTTPHPSIGTSPREAFERGKALSGFRPYRFIRYDEHFLDQTMISTPTSTAKIIPDRGFQLMYRHYWNDIFRRSDVAGTTVPIKFDPMNMGYAKAFVKGNWVWCISDNFNIFNGRSVREIKIATEEIRKQQENLHSGRTAITSKRLADFFESIEGKRILAKQHARDIEQRAMLQLIQGGRSSQEQSTLQNYDDTLVDDLDQDIEYIDFEEF